MKAMHPLRTAVVLTGLFVFSAGITQAQEPAPKMEVVDTYDWGETGPGSLKAKLEIKNVGGADLVISQVKPSCGCTTTGIDKDVIKPGDIGTVDVSLNATRAGSVTKTLTIRSNDPTDSVKIVWLKATVKKPVTVTPGEYFMLNGAVVGQESQATIRLKNTGDEPFTISPPEITSSRIKARFNITEDVELKPGEEQEIVMYATPLKTGMPEGKVVVHTSNPTQNQVQLNIYGTDISEEAKSHSQK